MELFRLLGTIAVNSSEATKELDKVSGKAKKTSKEIAASFQKIGEKSAALGQKFSGISKAAGGLLASLVASTELTRDYRTEQGKLEAAFTTSGYSAEAATKTFEGLQAVLGETDQSVEAANHLAKLCDTEQELQTWTDICTGVFATFGDSLPIEGLTEAANETAKVGQVTGPLADALNWAGVSEDAFNESLAKCSTEQERQALITETLNGLYKDAAKSYKDTNKQVMEANAAQRRLTAALSKIAEKVEPIITKFKNLGAAVLEKIGSMNDGVFTFSIAILGIGAALAPVLSAFGMAATSIGKMIERYGELTKKVTEHMAAVKKDTTAQERAAAAANKTRAALYGTKNAANSSARALYGEAVATDTSRLAKIKNTVATKLNTITTKLNNTAVGKSVVNVLKLAAAHKVATIAALGLAVPIIALAAYMIKTGASAEEVASQITEFADKLANMITEFANAFPSMVDSFVTAFTSILDAIVGNLPMLIPALLQAGITLFMTLVDSLTQIIKPLVAVLPSVIDAVVKAIIVLIPAILQAGITLFMALVDAIPKIIEPLVAAIPQIVDAVCDMIPTLIPALLQGAILLFMAFVQAIPEIVPALLKGCKQIINTVKTNIANAISKVWDSIKSTAKSKWESIKSAIISPVEKARDKVKSLINKIKSFFNFKWSLPELKMPHISITGKFKLNPPSTPKFSIKWYKKAMDEAMLLDSPTIFGYGDGSFLGGGEAGQEVVAGSETLMNMVKTVVAEQNESVVYYLQKLVAVLTDYFPQVIDGMDRPLYFNADSMASAMAVPMDKYLGRLKERKDRGR